MFRSFPLCLCGVGHRQSGATLNGNPKGRTTSKWVFPLSAVIYLAENLSGPKTFCSLSWFPLLIRNYFVFLHFFLFTFFRSSIGNPSFPFLLFSFLTFHFFLFIFSFSFLCSSFLLPFVLLGGILMLLCDIHQL